LPQNDTYEALVRIRAQKGAGLLVLIDPDKHALADLQSTCQEFASRGADAFLVGGSLLHQAGFDRYVEAIKNAVDLPTIGFPGSLNQISPSLDAILYLSVVSSRNPEYLFGQHVHAAPLLKRLGIEPISTGYMLVESGRLTTVQYMMHSMPLPRHKPDVAAATALAAEMMGMKMLYTDAGSGADYPVPDYMIRAIRQVCEHPLIVGGGLRSAEQVSEAVSAGADFVVVGHALEQRPDPGLISELAAAAHPLMPQTL
jgi:putative glycerol-1-phosphate prenyltransferase